MIAIALRLDHRWFDWWLIDDSPWFWSYERLMIMPPWFVEKARIVQ